MCVDERFMVRSIELHAGAAVLVVPSLSNSSSRRRWNADGGRGESLRVMEERDDEDDLSDDEDDLRSGS